MSKTYIGDTGTEVILDCGQDVSSASARTIEARKPDGSTVSWPAVAEGANGIKATSAADTFDQAGAWRLQARVTIGAGTWRGETATLRVFEHWT